MERSRLYATLFLGFIVILMFRYNALWSRFCAYRRRDDTKNAPPLFPYFFPLLGSLPFVYLWNPRTFVLSLNNWFRMPHPVRVKILHKELYVVQGAENIKAMFKQSWASSSIPFVKFAVEKAFGLPAKAAKLYDRDNSGSGLVPHPDSKVEPRNRIDHRVHQAMVAFLLGEGLLPFWQRFKADVTRRFRDLHLRLGSDWDHQTDLMQLVGDEAMRSFINSFCGPHLMRLSPSFLEDFWEFDRSLHIFLQGVPWIFAPRAYASRKKVLDAVKVWQNHAREHCTDAATGPDADDPFWGSNFFRERHKMFLEMDGYDHAAIASEDFGAIWAARNSISAASWTIFELYRDPELLAEVRAEVDSCILSTSDGYVQFDTDRLLRLPLLQSVYAEVLRLRMHFYIIRMPDRVDMEIRDWVIPRQKVICTSTTAAHMDSKAWNTGLNNEHPVDKFWAGRFLKYPTHKLGESQTDRGTDSTSPAFSLKEVEGSWIPYGGGPRQCPGRQFAKRQILLTAALFVTLFDCEVLRDGVEVKEELKSFSMGVAHPASKVPFKIRRRHQARI